MAVGDRHQADGAQSLQSRDELGDAGVLRVEQRAPAERPAAGQGEDHLALAAAELAGVDQGIHRCPLLGGGAFNQGG